METFASGPRRSIGVVCIVAALQCWGLLALTLYLRAEHPQDGRSSFLLTAVTLGALGGLGAFSGWRLVRGRPLGVNLRRLAGTTLLLLAANFWVAAMIDPPESWWPAVVLGVAGIAVFLSWKVHRPHE